MARIILTCGEPAGIGPELAAMLADHPGVVWLGDPRHLPPGTPWAAVDDPRDNAPAGRLAVLRHDFATPRRPGQPDPAHAADVIAVIERAVALVQAGRADAITTLPINKQALKQGAGFPIPAIPNFWPIWRAGPMW